MNMSDISCHLRDIDVEMNQHTSVHQCQGDDDGLEERVKKLLRDVEDAVQWLEEVPNEHVEVDRGERVPGEGGASHDRQQPTTLARDDGRTGRREHGINGVNLRGAAGVNSRGARNGWLMQTANVDGEKEKEEIDKECTFQPQIGRAPRRYDTLKDMPVEERLMLLGRRGREEDVKRWKEEMEAEMVAACTFQPQLLQSSSIHDEGKVTAMPPLYARLTSEWRKKKNIVDKCRMKVDEGVTFQPEVSDASRRLAERWRRREALRRELGGGRSKTHDENNNDGKIESNNVKANAASVVMMEQNACVPKDFIERQKYFDCLYQEKLRDLQHECEEKDGDGNKRFVASIPSKLLISSERLVGQLLERPEERWNRLALGDAEEARQKRERIKAQMEAEHRFYPVLNENSLRIAHRDESRKNLRDLVPNSSSDTSHRHSKAKIEEEVRELEMKECTFMPNIQKPAVVGFFKRYETPRPNAASTVSISKAIEEGSLDSYIDRYRDLQCRKENKAKDIKREQEEKELSECTFKPAKYSSYPATRMRKSLQDMPGMSKFMEHKEMADRLKAEQEERRERAFTTGHRWTNSATICVPFNLSGLTNS